MKILWVKSDFLHPANRGGQIRTLEMVKRLHARHEVHYVAFDDPTNQEGLRRSAEYCTKAHPVKHVVPPKRSLAFAGQLLKGCFSSLPVAIERYKSAAMQETIAAVTRQESFDALVCDFLIPAPNISNLDRWVLFQHNVETVIWQRHQQHASDPVRKAYFGLQAKRMFDYERSVCHSVAGIVAVSDADAGLMRSLFGVPAVTGVPAMTAVPTGVDIDYFARPRTIAPAADLMFVGSMDWMPNSDGVLFFAREVLPLIREKRPDCTVAIAGRNPSAEIAALAAQDPRIQVTGTVPDVRPYLWGSLVSIVPLRIGGGTRLKIYEAMAARVPVVSTTVGAEGLDVRSPEHIRLADSPRAFADACVQLLADEAERRRMADAAWELVASRFSWDHAVQCFEGALARCARG